MAQRFYSIILLPKIIDDISENKKLNYHLYRSLKKAVYKPAAFYKGLILPMCEVCFIIFFYLRDLFINNIYKAKCEFNSRTHCGKCIGKGVNSCSSIQCRFTQIIPSNFFILLIYMKEVF